jgi:hypothetical protein
VGIRDQSNRTIISGLSVLAAALLMSATAHAASNPVVPCDQIGRNLQSLEVPVDTLPLEVVDHTPIDPDRLLDEALVESDSATPVLDLTPRVTNILRDVFGASDEELTRETPSQPVSSPLADSAGESDEAEPAAVEIDRSNLPRIQQQMFRKDI